MTEISIGEVAIVNLDDIEIDDRAREELGDLNSLESSMKEKGLIAPLAVKRGDNGKFKLLAGGRRYYILKKNNNQKVSVRIYPNDITLIEIKDIELAENFYRKDFEWFESDKLIRDIDELKRQIHGSKPKGPGGEGWSLQDTADIIGMTKGSVSTAIARSEAREAFPELFEGCKTQKDATKVIKKLDEMLVKEQIARKLEADKSDSRVVQLANQYILGDFFEGVKKIPDGVMHLVEIDPPYAIDLINAKKTEGESIYDKESYNEVEKKDYQKFLYLTFRECYRVMAEHSWLLCWFAPEPWFEQVYNALTSAGFETTRMCGIWTKPSGQSKRPEMHLANSYEMFFYAWKGRPAINKAGRSNNFNYPPVLPQNKTHPTERPIELMKDLYETFAFPGSRVFIPFLGSGNGIIAAHQAGMTGIGFELGKSYRDSFLVKVHGMK